MEVNAFSLSLSLSLSLPLSLTFVQPILEREKKLWQQNNQAKSYYGWRHILVISYFGNLYINLHAGHIEKRSNETIYDFCSSLKAKWAWYYWFPSKKKKKPAVLAAVKEENCVQGLTIPALYTQMKLSIEQEEDAWGFLAPSRSWMGNGGKTEKREKEVTDFIRKTRFQLLLKWISFDQMNYPAFHIPLSLLLSIWALQICPLFPSQTVFKRYTFPPYVPSPWSLWMFPAHTKRDL